MPQPWTRPATAADAPRIARIHVDSWRETYTGLIPDELIAARTIEARLETWTRAARAVEGGGPHRLVVGGLGEAGRDGDAILGFAYAGPPAPAAVPGEPEPGRELGEELWTLYCLRAGQGVGLGSALLAAALPPGPAFCWALSTNAPALAFYRARAFEPEAPPVTRGSAEPLDVRLVRPAAETEIRR